MCLSLGKRIIQINVNKLTNENRIIPYSIKNKLNLKKFFLIFLSINYFTFLFFLNQNLDYFTFKTEFFLNIKDYNNIEIISLWFLYSVLVIRLFIFISKDLIKKDIYEYFLKDKVTIILLFLTIIVLIYNMFTS